MTSNTPASQAEHTKRTREAYDRLAEVWSSTTDDGPFNGLLERPALRALVPGNLNGAVVLEAGCGSGAQAQWLLDQGADVVGVDVSPRMIEEAERRCAGRGRFLVADLAEPLPLEPGSLDGVTCSLALHYVADWSVPLRSFASGLRPGGWAVVSLDHPFGPGTPHQQGGYFDTELVSDTWRKADVEVKQHFWRGPWRPSSAPSPRLASWWTGSPSHSPQPRHCGSSQTISGLSSGYRGSSSTGCGAEAPERVAPLSNICGLNGAEAI